jgi:hypothetical protein
MGRNVEWPVDLHQPYCDTRRGTMDLMPSVNIRQLRDTRRLKAWLQAGKTVELRERNRILGRIVPGASVAEPYMWPDFAGRIRRIFGERVLPGAELAIEQRGRY